MAARGVAASNWQMSEAEVGNTPRMRRARDFKAVFSEVRIASWRRRPEIEGNLQADDHVVDALDFLEAFVARRTGEDGVRDFTAAPPDRAERRPQPGH